MLLLGIHLMRSGEVEANLLRLNDEAELPYIDELVQRKLAGAEKASLDEVDLRFHESEYERLVSELEAAAGKSTLPDHASAKGRLNDLLVRIRLG